MTSSINIGGARAETKSVLQQERESVSHLAIPAVVIDQKGTIQVRNLNDISYARISEISHYDVIIPNRDAIAYKRNYSTIN